jgi:transposase InsO family protein
MRRPRRRGRSTGIIPTRAERLNHVWSWDFIADRTDNGGKLRILSILDEYSRECLALHVARKLTAQDLIDVMERLAEERGLPTHIRSDNGSEFIARVLQGWLAERNVKTLYIDPGSPWQNGHVESFHGSLRDECLDRELMLSVAEARVLIEDYRRHYNEERPHGGIGYRTPAQARMEAQALDSKHLDRFAGERIGLGQLRRSVAASGVGDALVGAEQVGAIDEAAHRIERGGVFAVPKVVDEGIGGGAHKFLVWSC